MRVQLLPSGDGSTKATWRCLIVSTALLLPMACAQGEQDGGPIDGLNTGATSGDGSSGSSSGGSSGSSTSSAGHSGSVSAAGSSAGGGSSGSPSAGGNSGASAGGSSGAATGGKGGGGAGGSSAGGSSGSAGSATAGSSSGGSGTAGAVAVGGSGGSAPASGFTVQYQALQTQASEAYMSALIHASNGSQGSVAVSQFKIRYYFTDEPKVQLQMTINYAHVVISGNQYDMTVTNTVAGLAPTFSTADTYIEFSFSCAAHATLAPGEALDFAWQVQGPDPSHDTYNQSNDYSFNASKTGSLSNWDHVVLFQSNAVIWGVPPS